MFYQVTLPVNEESSVSSVRLSSNNIDYAFDYAYGKLGAYVYEYDNGKRSRLMRAWEYTMGGSDKAHFQLFFERKMG
jgi:hypothetical protein